MFTGSVDEKPRVQAISTVAPNPAPKPGKHKSVARDYDYKRMGTVSFLAGFDLHDGKIIAKVHDRHRSREFVKLLKEFASHYHKESIVRIILDNHLAHISKGTMEYLESCPGRLLYVHPPKHRSWLNMIESLFSKMARFFLRHIRVTSKKELKERILKGI